MFSITDILALFNQLEQIACEPNHPFKSGARLLCDQYLNYLRKKEQNDDEEPTYFKFMFRNIEYNPLFNQELIKLIESDLINEKGKRHLELLKSDEINLVEQLEEIREKYRNNMSVNSQTNPVKKMQLGLNLICEFSDSALIAISNIDIQALFENDVKKIKPLLSVILSLDNITSFTTLLGNNYGAGFERLYHLISVADLQLKKLAILTLIRFKYYFTENLIYIYNQELVRSLFDSLGNKHVDLDGPILEALSLCSSDCFTQENIHTLSNMLIDPDSSLSQRHYALLCILSRSRERLARYFPQPSYPAMLIEMICYPDAYPMVNASDRAFFLTILFDTLSEVVSKKIRQVIIQEDLIRTLLRFSICNLKSDELPVFVLIIVRVYAYNRIASTYFETGTTEFLMLHIQSQQCDEETFIRIIDFLTTLSMSDAPTRRFCNENNLYHQLLVFLSQNKEITQDDEYQNLILLALYRLFRLDSNRIACSNEVTVNLMIDLLPSVQGLLPSTPQSTIEHALNYLNSALKKNTPAIQSRKKEVFQAMQCWFKTANKDNQARIIHLIATFLKNSEAAFFIDLDGYDLMKKYLYDPEIFIVRATIIALYKVIDCAEIANALLIDTPLIYKIGDLSNYSNDTDTRHCATVILDSVNRVRQNNTESKKDVPDFFFFGLKNRSGETMILNPQRQTAYPAHGCG